jgi:hypothetical protein
MPMSMRSGGETDWFDDSAPGDSVMYLGLISGASHKNDTEIS